MPEIFINGRFLTQAQTGVQRFAFELLSALDKLIEEDNLDLSITCLVPPKEVEEALPDWRYIHLRECGSLHGNFWEQIDLPIYARTGILISLCNRGPLFHRRHYVVIHDASIFSVPEAYSFLFRLTYRVSYYILARTARKIITVSNFSKDEISRCLQLSKKEIAVISEGCEHILRISRDDTILDTIIQTHRPFFLSVGSNSRHKNLEILIQALKGLSINNEIPQLVIVGGDFSKVFVGGEKVISENVKSLGFVTDEQLRSLYEHAIGFVFPSLYEGFGLPPLEAMICGCPVLCSNKASLPEICGEAALYFNPQSVEDIQSVLLRFLSSVDLREECRQSGFLHAQEYTWTRSARQLLCVLSEVHDER